MKNSLYILILIIGLSSCESYEEQEKSEIQKIYTVNYRELQNEEDPEIIDIDAVQNFKELTEKMGELSCERKIPGLNFIYEEKEYFLTGFSGCPTSNETACYFRRNSIIIKNDSIITNLFKNEKLTIEDLEIELNEIISKSSNYRYNEQILNPGLIYLYIDENRDIATTKKVLKEIVETFQKINLNQKAGFFEYDFLFEDFDRTKIPPPPPPPPLPEEI